MHDTMFRALTVLQDGGQWLGIAALGCTVGALRRRVRALEGVKDVFPIKISDLPYRRPTVFFGSLRHHDDDDECETAR
jgi:hypothetical protein